MFPLYDDGDFTTIKFINVEVKFSSSPIFTRSDICPIGHMTYLLKPTRGEVDLSRPNLEKTLVGSGLLDILRERLGFSRVFRSPLWFGVLDSEYWDSSWILEFLPKHPSKAASNAGLFVFFEETQLCAGPMDGVNLLAQNMSRIRNRLILLVGLDLPALLGLDLVLNKVIEMIFCANESTPLALSCGRTSRLDSDVRVSTHVVREYLQSGTLVGQGSAVIVIADADPLLRTSADLWMACERAEVVLESDVCPLCEDSVEESQHVFFQCYIAQCVIYRICRWWDLVLERKGLLGSVNTPFIEGSVNTSFIGGSVNTSFIGISQYFISKFRRLSPLIL
nr:RNA-directed DNA polymerase, eukaryota [Tanacetum cinerariifolium]